MAIKDYLVTDVASGQNILCHGMNTVRAYLRANDCRISNANNKYDSPLSHVNGEQDVVIKSKNGKSFIVEEAADGTDF